MSADKNLYRVWPDGYPRRETSQDALATLAVLEQLAAAPATQPAPAAQGDARAEQALLKVLPGSEHASRRASSRCASEQSAWSS